MTEAPKYSLVEVERRWLVDLSAIDLQGAAHREISDLYISESRMRLRKVSGPGELTFKLGKKYGKHTSLSESITNLYLSEQEYERLAVLSGNRSRKRRYSLQGGSLDIYIEPNEGLAIFEVEFPSEHLANVFAPPPFVTREVTSEVEFSGACLAQNRAAV